MSTTSWGRQNLAALAPNVFRAMKTALSSKQLMWTFLSVRNQVPEIWESPICAPHPWLEVSIKVVSFWKFLKFLWQTCQLTPIKSVTHAFDITHTLTRIHNSITRIPPNLAVGLKKSIMYTNLLTDMLPHVIASWYHWRHLKITASPGQPIPMEIPGYGGSLFQSTSGVKI